MEKKQFVQSFYRVIYDIELSAAVNARFSVDINFILLRFSYFERLEKPSDYNKEFRFVC